MSYDLSARIMVILLLVMFSIFLSFILSYPMMLIWNHSLVPAVSGLHEVSWSQMFMISILTSLVFKPVGINNVGK
jgi:hypothetical protein